MLGKRQLLGDDLTCPVHGIVNPVTGELEDHKPDPPGKQSPMAPTTVVPNTGIFAARKKEVYKWARFYLDEYNAKLAAKKHKKDKDEDKDEKPKLFLSEEVKMLTDPETYDDDPYFDDNNSVERSWYDLAGDD